VKRKREPEPYRSVWQSVVPVAVYLDDLEDTWKLLQRVGTVSAETDDFVGITTFDDLASLTGSRQRDVRLVAQTDNGDEVQVHLGPAEAAVTLTAPRLEFVGVRAQLVGILLRHWRGWSIADLGPVILLSAVLLPAIWSEASRAVATLSILDVFGTLALALSEGVLIAYAVHLRRTQWSILPMVRYEDRPRSLLVHRREELLMGLAFLLVGAVLGYLLGRWDPLGP
jgi:hypothetical protein